MSFTKKPLCAAIAYAMAAGMTLSAADVSAQQARERIEVTGTNIKRTDTETPSVVQIITREDIEKSGATSVAELIRELPANAGGVLADFNAGTGFSAAAQSASLRGLGSVATLVLLNGRRIAAAPYADPNVGQGTAFNLNTIPLSAIDRIEVLLDGASAVYGSDAIAGVINIILRKDYRGAEVAATRWQKSDGAYAVNQVSGVVGMGDLAKDRYNFLIAAEWQKRDPQPLNQSGSGVLNDDYARLAGRNTASSAISYPANVRRESSPGSGVFLASGRLPVDPRCPENLRVAVTATIQECRFNNFDYLNIVAEVERKGIMARGTFQVSPSLTAFAEASYTRVDSTFVSNPPGLDAAAPSTWFNVAGQRFSYTLILPVGHPDNPNNFRIGLRYRFADIGQTTNIVVTEATRAVAGVQGVFGAWEWESAVLFANNKREQDRNDILNFPSVQAAVNNATYRFSGSNSQALLDSLHPTLHNGGESKVLSWDLKGSRELMQLRGGAAALATGVEVRREEMDVFSDPRTVAGDSLGLASSNVTGSRTVSSIYGELSLPIFKTLETQLAGRYDHYSDFGGAFTPKVGFKWNATPTLAARGTWGKGFRAPSLFQISESKVQAFQAGIVDPLRCPNPPNPVPGGETEDCNRTVSVLFSANPNVQPEKSTSHTLGVLWSPTNSFQASIDYWYVHRMGFIDVVQTSTILNNANNPGFTGGAIVRNPNPETWISGIPNSGPIQSIISRFDNFGDQVASGYDFNAQYKVPLGAYGKLNLDAVATYYDKVLWQFEKGVDYVGGAGNFYAFESPRFKGVFSAVWDIRDFSVLGRYNYTSHWYYGDPTGSTPGGADNGNCYLSATGATYAYLHRSCYVQEWATFDVGVTYKGIRNLTLSVLVQNIKDTPAPFDPNQTTLGFNPRFHNPYGRYWQFGISYKFK